MKKTFLFTSLVVASALAFQACNNNRQNTDSVDSAEMINDSTLAGAQHDPAEFLVDAASGGMMEVELAQVAEGNALHPRVKSFAQMMLKDHTAANTELKTLSQNKGITLPQTLGEDHQKMVNDLKSKQGSDFDKAYMKAMVEDHKDAVEDFEDASKETQDTDIRAFALKTLPILKIHADSAKAIHDSLK